MALGEYLRRLSGGRFDLALGPEIPPEIFSRAVSFLSVENSMPVGEGDNQDLELSTSLFACDLLLISQGLGSGRDLTKLSGVQETTARDVINKIDSLLVSKAVTEVDRCALRAGLRGLYRRLGLEAKPSNEARISAITFAPNCPPVCNLAARQTPIWQKVLPYRPNLKGVEFEASKSELLGSHGVGTASLDVCSGIFSIQFVSAAKSTIGIPCDDFLDLDCVPICFEQMSGGEIVVAGTSPVSLKATFVLVVIGDELTPRLSVYEVPRLGGVTAPMELAELPGDQGLAVLDRYSGRLVLYL